MKNQLTLIALLLLFCSIAKSQNQQSDGIPLPEHPRPDFMRTDWATKGWIDGKSVGINQGGYTPFEFELTQNITWGSEQNIVFKIDDSSYDFKLNGKVS